jgi:hypothetical protein
MRHLGVFVAALLVGIALTRCVTTSLQPTPEPSPPPPAVLVPAGCLELQGGTWLHAADQTWRYEAEDDGGTLTLIVHHRAVVDAGFSPRRFRKPDGGVDAGLDAGTEDAGAPSDELPTARIELSRTDAGFVGATLTRFTHPTGRSCDVRFPTSVIACGDAGLTLETEESTALGDACQPPARPADVSRRQHHLRRLGIDAG